MQMDYIKEFLALFVLMTMLLYLVPGEAFKKYVRFFMEFVLTLGVLAPVLSFFYDSDEFLEKIAYEEFTSGLAELSKDTQKISFLQNPYYIEEYEQAIEVDVAQIAEQYEFTVTKVEAELSDTYELESVSLWITNQNQGEFASDAAEDEDKEYLYAGLKEKLLSYYQVDEEKIEIHYRGIG